jgi:subtilase family serine protease
MRCLVAIVLTFSWLGCAPQAPESSSFSLHKPRRLDHAAEIGGLDGREVLDLVFVMKPRENTNVRALLKAQERGLEPFVTPAEFADRFSPAVDEYDRVADWLVQHDIQVVRKEPGRTTLIAQGTVAAVEAAFDPRMRMFRDKGGDFRSPTREPSFPRELVKTVAAVIGLDTAAPYVPHHTPPQPAPNASSGTPADIQMHYGADQVTQFQGEGETVVILGAGYAPNLVHDIDPFVKKFMLPFDRKSQYTQIFLGGPNRDSDEQAQTEYGEAVLDIDMVMGMAPGASIIQIMTATNGALFESGFSYVVNYIPQAHQASLSYGFCERYAAGYVTPYEFVLQQAKAEGQQWFVSSGDYGTDGCGDISANAVLSADYPAVSQYVLSVGGTQQMNGTEVVWNGHGEKSLGGGGQSELFGKPSWQVGVGPYPNDDSRDEPDVAALADGVIMLVNGSAFASGGTSAAAPIWAGVWARLDQSQGGTGITNSHERLYQLGAAGHGFHDITMGDITWMSKGYAALPGYDLATGWGTPDLPNLIANWK